MRFCPQRTRLVRCDRYRRTVLKCDGRRLKYLCLDTKYLCLDTGVPTSLMVWYCAPVREQYPQVPTNRCFTTNIRILLSQVRIRPPIAPGVAFQFVHYSSSSSTPHVCFAGITLHVNIVFTGRHLVSCSFFAVSFVAVRPLQTFFLKLLKPFSLKSPKREPSEKSFFGNSGGRQESSNSLNNGWG